MDNKKMPLFADFNGVIPYKDMKDKIGMLSYYILEVMKWTDAIFIWGQRL